MFKIDMESNSITPLRVRPLENWDFANGTTFGNGLPRIPPVLAKIFSSFKKNFLGFPIRMNDSIYSLSISRGRWSSSKTNWTTPAATSRGRP
jgi:hypothetical protein